MTAVLEDRSEGLVRERPSVATLERIRLMVVDDHPAVRRGLRELLEDQPDFLVVATVSSAEDAMSLAERKRLDVAVTDYQLVGRNGLWLSRKLGRLPHPPRVLIYSAYCDGLLAAAAVVAGADGLVGKGGPGSDLSDAIRAVASGHAVWPRVPWRLTEVIRRRLDDQEQAIYGMRLAGIAVAEIAQTLGISDAALQARLSEMLRKLESRVLETTTSQPLIERSMVEAR